MANPLNRFHLSSSVNYSVDKDIDYIAFKSPLGDFKRIEDIDVVINSWNNILLTPRGSYDHDPMYGSGLFNLIFEPDDANTEILIAEEIERSIGYYDDRGKIKFIEIDFEDKSYVVNIKIEYKGEVKPLTLYVTRTE